MTNLDDQANKAKEIFPTKITLNCIRLVLVDSYSWEESENIFLINYKKLFHQENEKKNCNKLFVLLET